MAQEIIGREPEIKEIEALYQRNKEATRVHKKRDTGTDETCRRWRSLYDSEDSGSERLHYLVYQIRLSEERGLLSSYRLLQQILSLLH